MRSSVAASRRSARARTSWLSLAVAWASGGGRRRSSLPDFSTQGFHVPARGSTGPETVCAEAVIVMPASKKIHVKNSDSFRAFPSMFFSLLFGLKTYDLVLLDLLVTGCRLALTRGARTMPRSAF